MLFKIVYITWCKSLRSKRVFVELIYYILIVYFYIMYLLVTVLKLHTIITTPEVLPNYHKHFNEDFESFSL